MYVRIIFNFNKCIWCQIVCKTLTFLICFRYDFFVTVATTSPVLFWNRILFMVLYTHLQHRAILIYIMPSKTLSTEPSARILLCISTSLNPASVKRLPLITKYIISRQNIPNIKMQSFLSCRIYPLDFSCLGIDGLAKNTDNSR